MTRTLAFLLLALCMGVTACRPSKIIRTVTVERDSAGNVVKSVEEERVEQGRKSKATPTHYVFEKPGTLK